MLNVVEEDLRRAMEEHVADIAVPRSLIHDVKRRYRRRVRRRRLLSVTALTAALFSAEPVYSALISHRPDRPAAPRPHAVAPRSPVTSATPAPPSQIPKAGSPAAPAPPPPPVRPKSPDRPRSPGGRPQPQPWLRLAYLPPGFSAAAACADDAAEFGTPAVLCQWSGTGGRWIQLGVVWNSGVSQPADLGFFLFPASPAQVNGRSAIVGVRWLAGLQVTWTARPGEGLYMLTDASLQNDLLNIAAGVRLTR